MPLQTPYSQVPDGDLWAAFAELTKESVPLRPEYSARLQSLMQAEIRAEAKSQADGVWGPWWGWLAVPGRSAFGLRFAFAVACLSIALLGIASLGQRLYPGASDTQVALVTVASGEVTISRSLYIFGDVALTRQLSAVPGNPQGLRASDQVSSVENAEAEITFSDGSRTVLGPGTHLVIDRLQARTASSHLAIAMRLERGSVHSEVVHLRPGIDEFTLSTPNLEAHVKGTVFRVDVRPNGTRLATEEGTVQVSWDGQVAEVAAGQELEVLQAFLADSPPQPRAQAPQLRLTSEPPESAVQVAETGEWTFYLNAPTMTWQIDSLPGASVEIYINDELVNTIEADGNGLASVDFSPTSEGTYRISAVAVTPTGEKSRPSTAHILVFDRTQPSVVLTSPAEPQVTSEEIVVAGQTEPGVRLVLNGQPLTVDEKGNFQAHIQLSPGPNELAVEAIDRAGNAVKLQSVIIRR